MVEIDVPEENEDEAQEESDREERGQSATHALGCSKLGAISRVLSGKC